VCGRAVLELYRAAAPLHRQERRLYPCTDPSGRARLVKAAAEGRKLRLDGRLQQVPHVQLHEAAAAGGRDRQLAAAGRQVLCDHALAERALALHLLTRRRAAGSDPTSCTRAAALRLRAQRTEGSARLRRSCAGAAWRPQDPAR